MDDEISSESRKDRQFPIGHSWHFRMGPTMEDQSCRYIRYIIWVQWCFQARLSCLECPYAQFHQFLPKFSPLPHTHATSQDSLKCLVKPETRNSRGTWVILGLLLVVSFSHFHISPFTLCTGACICRIGGDDPGSPTKVSAG